MGRTAIVIGAGLVGLATARELHRQGWEVTVFDAAGPKREPARSSSWAGAGMLAAYQTTHPALRPLAIAGARLYPTWAAELERETYLPSGYRPSGTIVLGPAPEPLPEGWERLEAAQLAAFEPALQRSGAAAALPAWRVPADHSVDNRLLLAALIAAVRGRGLRLHENRPVEAVEPAASGLIVRSAGERFEADAVVNAAGAWAGAIAAPAPLPVRPRKGQMLAVDLPAGSPGLRHVLEAPGVYLVPRSGGRILIGATLEDVGFAADISESTLKDLHRRAAALCPALAQVPVVERWVGFRPCTPDELPLLGPTACPGYWAATGHYRDGILLAPLTAKIIARAMTIGVLTRALPLAPFLPGRFAAATASPPVR